MSTAHSLSIAVGINYYIMYSMNRIIIDTREPFEYEQSHVEGAINIPPASFMQGMIPDQLAGAPKDQEIIVYCRSGARSNTVSHLLRSFGFTNIINGVHENGVRALLARAA